MKSCARLRTSCLKTSTSGGGVPTRCFIYKRITGIGIDNCTDAIFCAECAVLYLNTLANRIEDEYGNGKA